MWTINQITILERKIRVPQGEEATGGLLTETSLVFLLLFGSDRDYLGLESNNPMLARLH